jgi:hypothetical protein
MSHKKWVDDTPYKWLERNLKRLGATMLLSAVYDLVLALVALIFPDWLMRVLGLYGPGDVFHFYLWPLVHLVFPCFCILAWMDIKRNVVIVTGAILARVLYALFMFVSVLVVDAHFVWAIWGGISLAWAVAHYVLLRMSDFGFWEVFSRAGNPPGMRRK